jgi:hypothetical protein
MGPHVCLHICHTRHPQATALGIDTAQMSPPPSLPCRTFLDNNVYEYILGEILAAEVQTAVQSGLEGQVRDAQRPWRALRWLSCAQQLATP